MAAATVVRLSVASLAAVGVIASPYWSELNGWCWRRGTRVRFANQPAGSTRPCVVVVCSSLCSSFNAQEEAVIPSGGVERITRGKASPLRSGSLISRWGSLEGAKHRGWDWCCVRQGGNWPAP